MAWLSKIWLAYKAPIVWGLLAAVAALLFFAFWRVNDYAYERGWNAYEQNTLKQNYAAIQADMKAFQDRIDRRTKILDTLTDDFTTLSKAIKGLDSHAKELLATSTARLDLGFVCLQNYYRTGTWSAECSRMFPTVRPEGK